MGINNSEDVLLNVLAKHKSNLTESLRLFLAKVSWESDDQVLIYIDSVLSSCQILSDILASKDKPSWIDTVKNSITFFKDNKVKALDGLMFKKQLGSMGELTKIFPIINQFKWQSNEEEIHATIDYDKIYEKVLNETNIPRIFDKIIALLKKIIDGEVLDSIKIEKSLKNLLSLIKKNKNKSYLSTYMTFNNWKLFVKNVLMVKMEKNDYLKAGKITIKEINEINKEMEDGFKKLDSDIKTEYNKEYDFDQEILKLSEPITKTLTSKEPSK